MSYSYKKLKTRQANKLLKDCLNAITRGNSIIVSGLGKNVPICEKIVGTLTSIGIRSHFMHTNSAVHGDLGMVSEDDVVILLSKSGETFETLELARLLGDKKSQNWLITCQSGSRAEVIIKQVVVLPITHEGDPWNLIPNNSSLVFLMFLQSLAMSLADLLPAQIEVFKQNHPGGSIGKKLDQYNN